MLTALALAGVLVALFLAAALATRESAQLAPVARDAADVVLPDGPLHADDVRRVRFGLSLRGYRMSEVDEVLERVARDLETRGQTAAPAPGAAERDVEVPADQAPPRVGPPVEEPGAGAEPVAEPVVPQPVTAPETHPVVLAASDEPAVETAPAAHQPGAPVVGTAPEGDQPHTS